MTEIHKLHKQIIRVAELLKTEKLNIPNYQRPYKWTSSNLRQLVSDLQRNKAKSAYRLGTLVFHLNKEEHQETLDLVDGQQRTLTLFLLVKALLEVSFESRPSKKLTEVAKGKLEEVKGSVENFLNKQKFSSKVSHINLYQNYQEAKRLTRELSDEDIIFLLDKCQLVTFVLEDESTAFQFFDSQNSRGRDLNPHDLLKAFHLREFSESDEAYKIATVDHWENQEGEKIANLFANYLYPVRNWAQGKSAREFTKKDIEAFKGINLDNLESYPYAELLQMGHRYVDEYNNHWHRQVDKAPKNFPFQLDQKIINGRRFFEMVKHYHFKTKKPNEDKSQSNSPSYSVLDDLIDNPIIKILEEYIGRHRAGDQYVRKIFDCALLFYIDKFGDKYLNIAIEKIFIWAYSLRLKMYSVQLASMDNHALNNNIFIILKEAITPDEFFNGLNLERLATNINSQVSNIEDIRDKFKELGYA